MEKFGFKGKGKYWGLPEGTMELKTLFIVIYLVSFKYGRAYIMVFNFI